MNEYTDLTHVCCTIFRTGLNPDELQHDTMNETRHSYRSYNWAGAEWRHILTPMT